MTTERDGGTERERPADAGDAEETETGHTEPTVPEETADSSGAGREDGMKADGGENVGTDVGTSVGFSSGSLYAPSDLTAVVVATLVLDVVVVVSGPQLLRFAAATLLLFVLPGYALVAAMYPGSKRATTVGRTPGLLERLALSFGVSIALLPIGAMVFWAASLSAGAVWLSRLSPLPFVTGTVLVGSLVAVIRRSRLPPEQRFSLPYAQWNESVQRVLDPSVHRFDRALNVVLAVSVLLAVGALGFGLASPLQGEQYTSTALLTPGEGGEPVASGYPTDLTTGEATELVLKLGNNEGADVQYTVVIRAEQMQTSGGETMMVSASELDRLSVAVADGETQFITHSVAPEITGEQIRLTYYVYRGDAPADVSSDSAYRVLYLWVTVEEA